ncbi:MAG: hypothetical protein ACRCZF_09170, partial [Gemmataceae bacterium]
MLDIHPPDEELLAHQLGNSAKSAEVSAHLDSCPSCQKRLRSLSIAHFRRSTPGLGGATMDSIPGAPIAPHAAIPSELASHPHYKQLRELGRGGMGVVYRATNTLMNRLEVLKVVNRQLLHRPGAYERF